jgi:hypothetical protein
VIETRPNQAWALLIAVVAGITAGCTRHRVDVGVQPIRVEPIHMIVDINIKVDRELDRFFDFEEKVDATAPVTQPTTAPATAPMLPSTNGSAP